MKISNLSSEKIETNSWVFKGENGYEIIRLNYNGDIFVKGKLSGNDKEIVDAIREFLKSQGFLPQCEQTDVSKSFYCNQDDGEYNNNPCPSQCSFCKQAEFLQKNVP